MTGEERMDALLEAARLRPSHLGASGALLDRHARAPRHPTRHRGPTSFEACSTRWPPDTRCPLRSERLEPNLEKNADRPLARAGRDRILAAADELTPMDVYFDGTDGSAATNQTAKWPRAPSPCASPPMPGVPSASPSMPRSRLRVSPSGSRDATCGPLRSPDLALCKLAEHFDLYLVLDFYESFCALTQSARAKDKSRHVAFHRPPPIPSARTPLTRPIVVAMSGPVASGKSTLARALADHLRPR